MGPEDGYNDNTPIEIRQTNGSSTQAVALQVMGWWSHAARNHWRDRRR